MRERLYRSSDENSDDLRELFENVKTSASADTVATAINRYSAPPNANEVLVMLVFIVCNDAVAMNAFIEGNGVGIFFERYSEVPFRRALHVLATKSDVILEQVLLHPFTSYEAQAENEHRVMRESNHSDST